MGAAGEDQVVYACNGAVEIELDGHNRDAMEVAQAGEGRGWPVSLWVGSSRGCGPA